MGTFRVYRALGVTAPDRFVNGSVAGWRGSGGITDQDLLDSWSFGNILQCIDNITGLSNGKTLHSIISFGFNLHSLVVILDGTDVVSYETLPAGFKITSVRISFPASFSASGYNGGIPGGATVDINFQVNSGRFNKQFLYSASGDGTTALGFSGPLVYDWEMVDLPTMLDVLGSTLQFDVNIVFTSGTPAGITLSAICSGFVFEGTYEIQSFSWTLEVPEDPVTPGTTTVHISSEDGDNGPALNFTNITSYDMQYVDSTGNAVIIPVPSGNVSNSSSSGVDILLPDVTPGDEPVIIIIVANGDGTQFSGSIILGQLITIFFTDGSGIYQLVKDKRNDTLYLNDSGEIFDFKIPNPLAKLSFIP